MEHWKSVINGGIERDGGICLATRICVLKLNLYAAMYTNMSLWTEKKFENKLPTSSVI